MESIEYYKALISDDEVIKALVKESKAREGEPFKEKTRVRPNLNFFQRTVTNLVSSNKRISTIPEFIPKGRKKHVGKVKPPHTLMREILKANKINFVKAEEPKSTEYPKKSVVDVPENPSTDNLNQCFNKSDIPMKLSTKSGSIHFNLNFDKDKFVSSAPSSISKDVSKHETDESSTSSDSSDASIISICSAESDSSSSLSSVESDVITISDSDWDRSSIKSEPSDKRQMKSEKVHRKKCKRKLQKKRKK